MGLSPGKIKHMKALSNKDGVIAAAAIDQRGSLQKSIAKERGVSDDQVTADMLSEFKTSGRAHSDAARFSGSAGS
jgi:tagatose 1,6-diphosphate aldolase